MLSRLACKAGNAVLFASRALYWGVAVVLVLGIWCWLAYELGVGILAAKGER